MPYITKNERSKYDHPIDLIVNNLLKNDDTIHGELNYIIYTIIKQYIDSKGLRYKTMQDIFGTIECCKLELYRRILGPYEDKAIGKNGDIDWKSPESKRQKYNYIIKK